jgi:hypothetical protein
MISAAKTRSCGSDRMRPMNLKLRHWPGSRGAAGIGAWLLMVLATGCSSTSHYLVTDRRGVEVVLHLPTAEEVRFASSRDGFHWHDARQTGRGNWRVIVPGKGGFRYFFVVDGSLYLPECPLKEYDDFGSETCIYQE